MITNLMSAAMVGVVILGQQAAAPGTQAQAPSVAIESVWDFVVKGGPVMIPIAACSLIAFTVILERLLSLRRCNVLPPEFVPGLKAALGATQDRKRALDYCEAHPSPVANIFAAGLRKLGEPAEAVRRQVEEAGQREVFRLRKFLRTLAVMASIAPMLGLLGTVTGMITCFQTVAASAEALGRTELLARGIYEAMITTAAGLIVAIPLILAHHAISAKVDRLVFEMDTKTIEFMESLSDLESRRPGAISAPRAEAELRDLPEAAAA